MGYQEQSARLKGLPLVGFERTILLLGRSLSRGTFAQSTQVKMIGCGDAVESAEV
jgi:hypothetical protein